MRLIDADELKKSIKSYADCGKTMQWHDEDEDGIPKYCWYCGASIKGVKND